MARKLGDVTVDVRVDNKDLQEGLNESERNVREFADRAGGHTDGLAKRFSILRETISKILIPAVIARQVTEAIAEFERLRAKVDQFAGEMRIKALDASRSLAQIGKQAGDPIEQQLANARELARVRTQQILDEAEAQEAQLRNVDLIRKALNQAAGLREGVFRSRAQDEAAVIDQQLRTAEARIERQRQARRVATDNDLIKEELDRLSIFEAEERESRRLHQEKIKQAKELQEEELRAQEKLKQIERERHEERMRQIRAEERARAQASAIGALGTTTSLGNVEALLSRIASRTSPAPWKR